MEKLIIQVEKYVSVLFETKLSSINFYHNLNHTKRVVSYVLQLTEWENSTEEERLLLQLAAWFHDIGYIEKDEGHEEVSAKIATSFLEKNGLDKNKIEIVKQLILVTKKDETPKNSLEKILKDADCGHVGSANYFELSNLLKQETSLKKNVKIEAIDWLKGNKDFFEAHQFYTDSAKLKWQPLKILNLRELQQKINKINSKINKKENTNKLGRGVETLFRVQLKNHIELSAIADTKANILLSVNAIIISVALSSLVPKLDSPSNIFLVIPTFILMVFSVTSIVLSVLSTRPKISKIKVTKEMVKNKQTNILFFGNFYKMTLEEFEWGIDYLIGHEDVLYNSLTQDLYYLGLVLERKYRLLRITYTVFMFGIIISALAFIISYYVMVTTLS